MDVYNSCLFIRYALLEQLIKRCRYWCFKFKTLTGNRMIETQYVCMQAKTKQRIVTVSVLRVSAYRMTYICGMHANLILPPRFQFELN